MPAQEALCQLSNLLSFSDFTFKCFLIMFIMLLRVCVCVCTHKYL